MSLRFATTVQASNCQGEAPVLTLIGLAIAGASLIATLMTVPEFRGYFFSASEPKPAPSAVKTGSSIQQPTAQKTISTPDPSTYQPVEPPIQRPVGPVVTPLPQVTGAVSASRPFGAASKSWCLSMKQQWQFRQKHFQQNDESIKAAMEEKDCSYWGIRAE